MQQTVFVTGANGLIGRKLVQRLAGRRGIRVVALSRGKNRAHFREGYFYEALDLSELQEVALAFNQYQPSAVINCAGLTKPDLCEEQPLACHRDNVEVVQNLLGLCETYGTRLLQLSTDFVFDGEEGPYAEEDPVGPLNAYGRAKLEAERLVQTSGLPYAILRTVLVYGHAPNLGRGNIVLWVKSELEAGRPIQVVDDQYRTPTLAEDVVDGAVAALMGQRTGLYHLSGTELMSVFELAQRVAAFFRLDSKLISPVKTQVLKEAARRPLRTGLIVLKAQTELGFQPHSLEDGLAILERQLLEA